MHFIQEKHNSFEAQTQTISKHRNKKLWKELAIFFANSVVLIEYQIFESIFPVNSNFAILHYNMDLKFLVALAIVGVAAGSTIPIHDALATDLEAGAPSSNYAG